LHRHPGCRGEFIAQINPAPAQRRGVKDQARALINHSRNCDADTLTSGLYVLFFHQLADSCRQIFDEFRDVEDRVKSFEQQLLAREIAKHQKCFTEAHIDRDCQTISSSNMQERGLASTRRLARSALVD
jgi:hypothetical protein